MDGVNPMNNGINQLPASNWCTIPSIHSIITFPLEMASLWSEVPFRITRTGDPSRLNAHEEGIRENQRGSEEIEVPA